MKIILPPKILAPLILLLAVFVLCVVLPPQRKTSTIGESPTTASKKDQVPGKGADAPQSSPSPGVGSIPASAVAGEPEPRLPSTEPLRDPWTRKLIADHTPDLSRNDPEALESFKTWLKNFPTFTDTTTNVDAAVELATRRRAALKELLKRDPAAAFAEMTPKGSLPADLPPEILALLETEIDQIGDWHVQSICFWDIDLTPAPGSPDLAPPEFTYNPNGPLHEFNEAVFDADTARERRYYGFPVGALIEAGTRTGIPLRGFAIDNLAVFESALPEGEEGDPPVAEAPGESASGQMDALPFSVKSRTLSLGYRTLLYMRVAFSDNPGASPQTENSAYSNLRTANNHVIESSYGRMQMLTTVTPVITLPGTEAFYQTEGVNKLHADARSAASALGYTISDYSHRVVRYNGGPGTFGGLASVGGEPGNVWLRGSGAGLAVHELGHNYTLHHSGFWNGIRKSSIGPGSDIEYGHSHDPMGSADLADDQFCSYHKQRMGWLKDTEWIDLRTSGRYRIAPLDDDTVDPGKRYAIKIDKDGNRKYWLEYRRNYTTNPFTNGVLIQGEKFVGNDNKATLLDVTYWSKKEKDDACIPLGWTFSDYEHGIHVTPVARAGNRDWIDLQVNLGQFPGNQAPVLVLTSNKTTAATGETIQFTASATDADGDELAYHWYCDDNDFHRNLNQAVIYRAWSSAGIYSVVCTVTDMKGGISVQSIPITVGSPPSSEFTVIGNVDDHSGAGVRGAPVDNNLDESDANYRSTITDDNGDYTLTQNIAGDYTFNCRLEGDILTRSYSPVPYTLAADATGIDFRAKVIAISSSPATLAENGGAATFTLSRVGPSTGQFDVAVSFSGAATLGTDYSVSPAPVGGIYTIPSGAGTNLVINVTGLNDGDAEGPEDIVLAMGPTGDVTLTGPTHASLTIDDDDTTFPRLVLAPIDRVLNENGGMAQARITRFGDTSADLTVGLGSGGASNTATYNADYEFSHGAKNITIPAGESSAILTILGIDDGNIEGREQMNLSIINGDWIKDPSQRNALIHVVDDDIPEIDVTAFDNNTGEGNGGTGAVRFTASGAPTSPLDVEYCVRGDALHGTDYAQTTGILTIPAGQTFADITITGLADTLVEGGESAIVRAAAHNSDYTLGASVEDMEATVTINNKALLSITGPPSEASEFGPVSTAYQLSRAGVANTNPFDVTIAYSGSAVPGVDFVNPGTIVTIPAGSPTVNIDIDPLPDSFAEGDESLTLTITPTIDYAVGPANQALATITDLPIDAWRVAKFGADANNPAIAGDLIDPENDGAKNLLEFGLLLEPLIVDSSQLPSPAIDSGFLSITYTRYKNAGVAYEVRWSSSLAPNDWSSTGVTEQILSQTSTTETVKAKVAVDSTLKFIRVGVSR